MAKPKSKVATPRATITPTPPTVDTPTTEAGDETSNDPEDEPATPMPKDPPAAEAPRKTVRARVVLDTPEDAANPDDQHVDQPTEEEVVTVLTPKTFRLTLDNGAMVEYKAGNPTMPRSHAEHFYAKANGVTIKA